MILVRSSGLIQYFELKAYDVMMVLRPRQSLDQNQVAIVAINDDDINKYITPYPLSDEQMTNLLVKLESFHPRVIGVDIIRDKPQPPGTSKLEGLFSDQLGKKFPAPIIFIYRNARSGHFVAPPAALSAHHTLIGFDNVEIDSDGVVRRFLLYDKDDISNYAIAFRMAAQFLHLANWWDSSGNLKLGSQTISRFHQGDGGYANAGDGGFQILLDYKSYGQIPAISYGELLNKPDDYLRSIIENKAVLVGITADSAKDEIATPMDPIDHGVYYHAWALDQLLRIFDAKTATINVLSRRTESAYILLWSLIGGMIAYRLRSAWQGGIVLGVALVLAFGIAYFAFFRHSYWLPLVPPLVVLIASASAVTSYLFYCEREDRAALHRLLDMTSSRAVAKILMDRKHDLFDRGRLRPKISTATILFTDLENFTGISEGLMPELLMKWVDQFISRLSSAVADNHGVVLKYIGDAIMAGFGIPNVRADGDAIGHEADARAAVLAAIAMRAALIEQNKVWAKDGLPSARMRIGIFTGPLVSGSVGSASRLEYTCFGDTVNTASRLQSFDKNLMEPDIAPGGCRILIGSSTLALIGNGFKTLSVGQKLVDHKSTPVEIHAVIGGSADLQRFSQE